MNQLIKNPKHDYIIKSLKNILIYFKQGFHVESTFAKKETLFTFLNDMLEELFLYYKK